MNERHLRQVLTTYLHDFNEAWPHRALAQLTPTQADAQLPHVINLVATTFAVGRSSSGSPASIRSQHDPTGHPKLAGQAHNPIFKPHRSAALPLVGAGSRWGKRRRVGEG